MKRFIIPVLALCMLAMSGFAQTDAMKKLSLDTRKVLIENGIISVDVDNPKVNEVSRARMAKKIANAKKVQSLSCFVKVDDASAWDQLRSEGCNVRTIAGNIATVTIPIDKVLTVAEIAEVQQISITKKREVKMDVARPTMNIGDTYETTDEHPAITGSGVIVGVVDGAIDYRHPTMYSTDGSTYRVKSVLEQVLNDQGETETNLLTTQEEILAKGFSDDSHRFDIGGHGTHVTGIAAGGGYTNSKYHGVAYDSDIILVPTTLADADLVDGVSYIFEQATEQGKPAVVNLSLGSSPTTEPSVLIDGTDMLDQMLDQMVGENPGRIVTAASGNERRFYHAHSNAPGEALNMYVQLPFLEKEEAEYYIVSDQKDDVVRMNAYLVKFEGSERTEYGPLSFTSLDVPESIDMPNGYVIGYATVEGYPFMVALGVTTIQDQFGGKPGMLLEYEYMSNEENAPARVLSTQELAQMLNKGKKVNEDEDDCPMFAMRIEVSSDNGTVHYWDKQQMMVKSGNSYVACDDHSATVDSPGSANKVITVGSYTTQKSYVSENGTTFTYSEDPLEASYFSSEGPTLDGRIKPDVSAPGAFITSSFNKEFFDYMSNPDGDWTEEEAATIAYEKNMIKERTTFNGEEYLWGYMQGTSMACPAMTGAIALWLQANPKLTHADVMEVIENTSIQDQEGLTYPNNVYGYGRVNVLGGVKYILENKPISGIRDLSSDGPLGNTLQIKRTGDGQVSLSWLDNVPDNFTVSVYDMMGRVVSSQSVTGNNSSNVSVNVPVAGHNVYVVKVASEGSTTVKKLAF